MQQQLEDLLADIEHLSNTIASPDNQRMQKTHVGDTQSFWQRRAQYAATPTVHHPHQVAIPSVLPQIGGG